MRLGDLVDRDLQALHDVARDAEQLVVRTVEPGATLLGDAEAAILDEIGPAVECAG